MSGGLDIIKQYLISIGFDIDKSSMDKVNRSMDEQNNKIKKTAEQTQNATNETTNLLKGMYSLISSVPTLKNILPSEINQDIDYLLKKLNEIQKIDINSILYKFFPKDSEGNTKQTLDKLKDSISKFTTKGEGDILRFSLKSAAYLAIVATAFKVLKEIVSKTIEVLGDLAEADIGYEKLARQLWTTKENAREVTKALDVLGASMQDLWLSPTLLKQFNQLRKDSAALKLPPEYKENLKIVQDIGLQWNRTKQLGSIALEWIGNSIIKYCKGPLEDIRRLLNNENNYLIKNLPKIADLIGKCISIPLKIALKFFEGILEIGNTFGKVISFFNGKLDDTSTRSKKIFSILKESLSIFNLFLLPLKAVYLILDDIFTFLTGGKSVIGYVLDGIKEKIDGLLDINKIKDKLNDLFEGTEIGQLINNITNWVDTALSYIDSFINSIKESLSDIPVIGNLFDDKDKKEKYTIDVEKNYTSNEESKINDAYNSKTVDSDSSIISSIFSAFKKTATNMMTMAIPGVSSMQNAKNLYDSYKNISNGYYSNVSNASTSTNNSNNNNNNTVNNYNTYNITGSDANANASAINSRQNQITTRSLQGVFD